MTHWSAPYVGLRFAPRGRERGGIDCYGLLRLVWAEVAGVILPRHDGCCDEAGTIARESMAFTEVAADEARPLDAVIMNTDVMECGKWVQRPLHMGVVAAPGWVLHIEHHRLSRIDRAAGLRVVKYLRCPQP